MKLIVLIIKISLLTFLSWCWFEPVTGFAKVINRAVELQLLEIFLSVIISIVCAYISFELFKQKIWWNIGYFIAEKKYKGGFCGTLYFGPGCPCCSNPHKHLGSFAYWGPFTFSKFFVRKFICKEF